MRRDVCQIPNLTSIVGAFDVLGERTLCWRKLLSMFGIFLKQFVSYFIYRFVVHIWQINTANTLLYLFYGGFRQSTKPKTSQQSAMLVEYLPCRPFPGGLIGIIKSDTARDKWCLSYNDRSRFVGETSVIFTLATDDTESAPSASKDIGTSKITRNREDALKLADQLRRFQCSIQKPKI